MNRKKNLDLALSNVDFTDLNPELIGMEECGSNHSWGPGARSNYHLHFVTGGEGRFVNASGEYHLQKGDGFLFIPGERIYYQASSDNPWSYYWIGFTGEKASILLEQAALSQTSPIFQFDSSFDIEGYFSRVQSMDIHRKVYVLSVLYYFFSLFLNRQEAAKKSKVDIAIHYILQNYASAIHVESIARYLNIDRRYFSRLFMAEMGLSPQQYIINVRMIHALELLRDNTELNVSDVARSVGYNDPLSFSIMFKKQYHLSPSDIQRGVLPPKDGASPTAWDASRSEADG